MSQRPKSLTQKSFYFLRHGETQWNKERKWQGSKDIPLNETGLAQARAVRPFIDGLDIKSICVSPLQRAVKTAELAAGHLSVPLQVIEDLKEVGFGPHEGASHNANPWYMDWREGLSVEGVEDYRDFIDRGLGAINRSLTNDGPVLIVAHGGVFWSVREHAGLDPELGAWNCALFKLTPPTDERPFWLNEALNSRE